MIVQDTCQHCNKTYEYDTKNYNYHKPRQFCSRECYFQHRRESKEERVCPVCKKVFYRKVYEPALHCSKECTGISQRKKYPTKICAKCGKQFEHRRKDTEGKYCSRKCSDTADKTSHLRLERIKKVCPFCQKDFECAPYHETVCCSIACSQRYRALAVQGKQHPLYKERIRVVCKACGKVCYRKPAMAERFGACSLKCLGHLNQMNAPKISSLEIAMLEALNKYDLHPIPQYRIAPYVIDLAFPEKWLVIECDGDYWHSRKGQKKKDKRKDKFLHKKGWRVLRITESDIKNDINDCVNQVLEALNY